MNHFLDRNLELKRGKDVGGDGVHVVLDPKLKMASGDDGYLHFSVVTTVAEEASWWALDSEHAVPSQVSVSLLRPATVSGGTITGVGRILRKGKNVMVAQGDTMQGGKLICQVTATFVYFEKK